VTSARLLDHEADAAHGEFGDQVAGLRVWRAVVVASEKRKHELCGLRSYADAPLLRRETGRRTHVESARRSSHASRDEQVARALGQDSCFAAVAVLSSERRDTIEFVPLRNSDRRRNGVSRLRLHVNAVANRAPDAGARNSSFWEEMRTAAPAPARLRERQRRVLAERRAREVSRKYPVSGACGR
jgi:hypothetical protein